MKKKMTAFLTAFLCAFSMVSLHSAASGEQGIITRISYDENGDPERYFVKSGVDEFTFHISDVLKYYDGPTLECGDVVIVNCYGMEPIEPGICIFEEGNSIEYVGKAADICPIVTLTATKREGFTMYAQDASGVEYTLDMDYFYATLHPGDVIEFAVMDDKLSYATDVSPLGDTNDDGVLDILDVILMNRAVLTGEQLPALKTAASSDETDLTGEQLPALKTAASSGKTDLGQCDFNGNGKLDFDDSLGMLKRILGIE